MSTLWKGYLLALLSVVSVALLGFAAQALFGCTGDIKSYRECLVGGLNVAGTIFGMQYFGLMVAVWVGAPLGVILLAVSTIWLFRR